eukprot:tig00021535_g22219.t1
MEPSHLVRRIARCVSEQLPTGRPVQFSVPALDIVRRAGSLLEPRVRAIFGVAVIVAIRVEERRWRGLLVPVEGPGGSGPAVRRALVEFASTYMLTGGRVCVVVEPVGGRTGGGSYSRQADAVQAAVDMLLSSVARADPRARDRLNVDVMMYHL